MAKALLVLPFLAAPFLAPKVVDFDLKDPKGVNALTFHLDGGLEPFAGTANEITGSVSLDLDEPAKSSGKVVVAAKSVTMPLPAMSDNMQGEFCLDTDNHPWIVFLLKSLKNVKKSGETITATAVGDFTLRGVTKTIEVPVKAVRYVDGSTERTGGTVKGDLLRVTTEFTIKRLDYGVGKTLSPALCSDEVTVRMAIAGTQIP